MMNITINMTVEEFEDFRHFQKEKEIRELAAEKALRALILDHESLCTSLLNAFGEYVNIDAAEIKERGHLEDALNKAQECFC